MKAAIGCVLKAHPVDHPLLLSCMPAHMTGGPLGQSISIRNIWSLTSAAHNRHTVCLLYTMSIIHCTQYMLPRESHLEGRLNCLDQWTNMPEFVIVFKRGCPFSGRLHKAIYATQNIPLHSIQCAWLLVVCSPIMAAMHMQSCAWMVHHSTTFLSSTL